MLLNKIGQFQYQHYNQNKEQQLQEEINLSPIQIITQQINYILNTKNCKRVYFLKGGTGSGKSSLFVDQLLQMCNGKKMICTKPRQQLVKDSMTDLPKNYPRLIPGVSIGYKVGGGDYLLPSYPQSVLFMTTQILTNMILQQKWDEVFKYRFIAIDEVHEMNDQMIECLYFVKYFLDLFADDPNCPLFIMMSATIYIPKFIKYYKIDETDQNMWARIGFIKPAAMRYNVDKFYVSKSQDSLNRRLDEACEIIEEHYSKNKIHLQEYKDILIFTEGGPTMTIFAAIMINKQFSFPKTVLTYSRIDLLTKSENYHKFIAKTPGVVKIIVSTNLLESGVNIENLYTVIDTGIRATNIYNNIQEKTQFISLPISESSLEQRVGRVGRNGPGMYIGLYSQKRKFAVDDLNPVITKIDIFQTMFLYLTYKLQDIKTVEEFINKKPKIDLQDIDLIEPMSSDIVLRTYDKLMKFGLIQRNNDVSISLFILIKQKYDGFIKFICQYYQCSPVETVIIQFVLTRQFKFKKQKTFTKQQIFEMFMVKDFKYIEIPMVLECYKYIYETMMMQEYYYNLSYDMQGYKNVFTLFE